MEMNNTQRWPSPPDVAELITAAVVSWRVDAHAFAAALDALMGWEGWALPDLERRVEVELDWLWTRGWTPTDVMHVVMRQFGRGHAQVVATHVVADGRRRREHGEPLHRRWVVQLADIEDDVSDSEQPPDELRLRQLVEVLCLLDSLPAVPTTMPPPGTEFLDSGATSLLDTRMLARVRALLAKAESTTFEEEADALTAKAQELIARYAIDEARLHTVDDVGEPSVRRIHIDDPYADPKASLIAEVADANRCRVVHSTDLGWVTAFGYDHDLDAVELLANSLLAQATAAMARQGSRRDATGRSRTRSFRRAFLFGFAERIGERLQQATSEQMSAADDSNRFAPVLAARDNRLQTALAAAFPDVVQRTTVTSNVAGLVAGRDAADQASLNVTGHRLPAP